MASHKDKEMEKLAAEFNDQTLNEIIVEGLVVMKIVKHTKDNLPEISSGQLLGMELADHTVEVSNCFPVFTEEEPTHYHNQQQPVVPPTVDPKLYPSKMLEAMALLGADSKTVGWYTSACADSLFADQNSVAMQFDMQSQAPKAVMLVFDPLRTTQEGTLALKGYRLKTAFMELFKAQTFTVEALSKAKLSYQDIFEEVKVKVRTGNGLSKAFIGALDADPNLLPEYARFDLSIYPFLEKNLEYLAVCMEELVQEQSKFQNYQRSVARQNAIQAAYSKKKAAASAQAQSEDADVAQAGAAAVAALEEPTYKAPPQPPQLQTLLLSTQIGAFCDQINRSASQSVSKLFMLGGLQKKSEASP